MTTRLHEHNHLALLASDIQYLPHHCCPKCGAAAETDPAGQWLAPYQDWYHTSLAGWARNLGYIRFQCDCFSGSLRVVRLGDAVIPIEFDMGNLAHQLGLETAQVNADRVRQAVNFLARHADPEYTSGSDMLTHILYAVAAGATGPDEAHHQIELFMRKSSHAPVHRLFNQKSTKKLATEY